MRQTSSCSVSFTKSGAGRKIGNRPGDAQDADLSSERTDRLRKSRLFRGHRIERSVGEPHFRHVHVVPDRIPAEGSFRIKLLKPRQSPLDSPAARLQAFPLHTLRNVVPDAP